MSEGLEELKTIRHIHDSEHGQDKSMDEKFGIIEKELKRLEDIDSILNTGGGLWACDGVIDKKIKALEIITKAYADYANYKISEYELIMIVAENTTY